MSVERNTLSIELKLLAMMRLESENINYATVCRRLSTRLVDEGVTDSLIFGLSSIMVSRLLDYTDASRLSFLVRRVSSQVATKSYCILARYLSIQRLEDLCTHVMRFDCLVKRVVARALVAAIIYPAPHDNDDNECMSVETMERLFTQAAQEISNAVLYSFGKGEKLVHEEGIDNEIQRAVHNIIMSAHSLGYTQDIFFELSAQVRNGLSYSRGCPELDMLVAQVLSDSLGGRGCEDGITYENYIVTLLAEFLFSHSAFMSRQYS